MPQITITLTETGHKVIGDFIHAMKSQPLEGLKKQASALKVQSIMSALEVVTGIKPPSTGSGDIILAEIVAGLALEKEEEFKRTEAQGQTSSVD